MKNNWIKAEKILDNNGVGVLPTDTLYGVVGSALSKKAVERIYIIKGRIAHKPFIVLINSYKQLEIFGVKLDKSQAKILEKFWPGKTSIILPAGQNKWKYLHRGTNSIAFRMIGKRNKNLFNLINKVGPLVAPSANLEGDRPAETIGQAKKYFEGNVDFYIDGGRKAGEPSTLIKIIDDGIQILRKGK